MFNKTVLVVAYYFPPIAASGSMRPLGFCRYLREYGWQPRVLTTDPKSVYPAMGVDVANTAELCTKLRSDHPDLEKKFVTITNGFDDVNYNPTTSGKLQQGVHAVGNPAIELCHFGSVYGKRTPLLLLQAVKELIDERQIRPDQLRIRFVGAWDVTETSCENLARELEQRGII
jgi:hypothetical protein